MWSIYSMNDSVLSIVCGWITDKVGIINVTISLQRDLGLWIGQKWIQSYGSHISLGPVLYSLVMMHFIWTKTNVYMLVSSSLVMVFRLQNSSLVYEEMQALKWNWTNLSSHTQNDSYQYMIAISYFNDHPFLGKIISQYYLSHTILEVVSPLH